MSSNNNFVSNVYDSKVPSRGNVYWICDKTRRVVVISPQEINALGLCIVAPIVDLPIGLLDSGLIVSVHSERTSGVVVCNQLRSVDIQAREQIGDASFIEVLSHSVMAEVVARAASVIDPAV